MSSRAPWRADWRVDIDSLQAVLKARYQAFGQVVVIHAALDRGYVVVDAPMLEDAVGHIENAIGGGRGLIARLPDAAGFACVPPAGGGLGLG